jgi:hypothetical protein
MLCTPSPVREVESKRLARFRLHCPYPRHCSKEWNGPACCYRFDRLRWTLANVSFSIVTPELETEQMKQGDRQKHGGGQKMSRIVSQPKVFQFGNKHRHAGPPCCPSRRYERLRFTPSTETTYTQLTNLQNSLRTVSLFRSSTINGTWRTWCSSSSAQRPSL